MNAPATVPRGFEIIRSANLRALVRSDLKHVLSPLLLRWVTNSLPASRPLLGGRGGAQTVDLEEGLAVVVRPYRRGGMLRRVNKNLYFGLRPRPFRELQATELMRARGVPTIEPMAAAILWLFPGCYRGVFISREAPGAVNLWHHLRSVPPRERVRACAAVAAVTRKLHDAGVVHPDLNLQNYLVCQRGDQVEVLIIDCDRVRTGQVFYRDRLLAATRLCRSVRRLDPNAEVITSACVEKFHSILPEQAL